MAASTFAEAVDLLMLFVRGGHLFTVQLFACTTLIDKTDNMQNYQLWPMNLRFKGRHMVVMPEN